MRNQEPVATLKLQPFTVPNFVLVQMPARPRQEGFREGLKFALSELDADTLAALCDQFRLTVFAKAGVADSRSEVVSS